MSQTFLGKLSDRVRAARCPRASAVIVAAGSGVRFGADKLAADLGGKPVLVHCLGAFERSPLVSEIVLVTRADALEKTAALCAQYGITKLTKAVPGGETRAASSFAGVMAASDASDIIAIHDGARPLVTDAVIEAAIWEAHKHGASVPAIPLRDTVKQAAEGVIVSTPDRDGLRAVQTPQCFQRDVIRGALLEAAKKQWQITDDCMAVERIGGRVWLTEGSEENIKITTPLDLALAEIILKGRSGA